jgi:hypothetical protein
MHCPLQLFTGLTAWLLATAYMFFYATGIAASKMLGLVDLAISAVYSIFWLAAAAATTPNNWGSTAQAGTAFGYLSWLAWMPSIYFAFLDYKNGQGIAVKAVAPPAPAPAPAPGTADEKPVDEVKADPAVAVV